MQERADLSETKNHVKYQNLEDEVDDALAFTMKNINALFKAS